jgi:hypothetical protein
LDHGASLLGDVVDLCEHPAASSQRVVGELDPGAADVLVGVVDVDVAGAVP